MSSWSETRSCGRWGVLIYLFINLFIFVYFAISFLIQDKKLRVMKLFYFLYFSYWSCTRSDCQCGLFSLLCGLVHPGQEGTVMSLFFFFSYFVIFWWSRTRSYDWWGFFFFGYFVFFSWSRTRGYHWWGFFCFGYFVIFSWSRTRSYHWWGVFFILCHFQLIQNKKLRLMRPFSGYFAMCSWSRRS